jgi:hypothetical protein
VKSIFAASIKNLHIDRYMETEMELMIFQFLGEKDTWLAEKKDLQFIYCQ